MKPGDQIQIVYKREKTWTIDIIQGSFIKEDGKWLYLDNGKFNINKIKGLRNLTKEQSPPEIEDE